MIACCELQYPLKYFVEQYEAFFIWDKYSHLANLFTSDWASLNLMFWLMTAQPRFINLPLLFGCGGSFGSSFLTKFKIVFVPLSSLPTWSNLETWIPMPRRSFTSTESEIFYRFSCLFSYFFRTHWLRQRECHVCMLKKLEVARNEPSNSQLRGKHADH